MHIYKILNLLRSQPVALHGMNETIGCNDPKPLCKDHHGFGVFLNFSGCGILSNTLLTVTLRVLLMCLYVCMQL
jgi:hypothetical protein